MRSQSTKKNGGTANGSSNGSEASVTNGATEQPHPWELTDFRFRELNILDPKTARPAEKRPWHHDGVNPLERPAPRIPQRYAELSIGTRGEYEDD